MPPLPRVQHRTGASARSEFWRLVRPHVLADTHVCAVHVCPPILRVWWPGGSRCRGCSRKQRPARRVVRPSPRHPPKKRPPLWAGTTMTFSILPTRRRPWPPPRPPPRLLPPSRRIAETRSSGRVVRPRTATKRTAWRPHSSLVRRPGPHCHGARTENGKGRRSLAHLTGVWPTMIAEGGIRRRRRSRRRHGPSARNQRRRRSAHVAGTVQGTHRPAVGRGHRVGPQLARAGAT